jgi:shikimate kinase
MTNIVLTGPMGSGKTTVGELAARILGARFVDTDRLAEQAAGLPIPEIFSKLGEPRFRELESDAIASASAGDGLVIATGGGAVLDPRNMRRLRMNGVIVNLTAHPNVLSERVAGSAERPLLDPKGSTLRGYLWKRMPFYLYHDFRIDTGSTAAEQAAREVARIAGLTRVRICASISGELARRDLTHAARNGATMAELRLDLIPDPDVKGLVEGSPIPIVAAQRGAKDILPKAVEAGCEYVDIEHDCRELDALAALARRAGCKVIVSVHDEGGVPERLPDRRGADILKVAATVKSEDDVRKLEELQKRLEDAIAVPMGPLGAAPRLRMPLLGAHHIYCHVGNPTAPGQPSLEEAIRACRGLGLR